MGIEFAGSYGFTLAHYLQQLGFPVVSVLPAHTKRQKEITHNQALKTDAKDAISIADLLVQGKFVSFPFLNTVYADLRYLVSAREHVAVLKNAALTRLLAVLDIVFPEYGTVFSHIDQPTALAILKQYPGPDAILRAKKRSVVALLKRESRGHLGEKRYETLCTAARATLALPGAQGVLADELALIIARLEVFTAQLETLKQRMIVAMERTPEATFLLTIPGVQPVTAATFLGSIGDPQAYESAKQVLKVAGLSLVERSSGIHKGKERISKRGRPTLRRHAFMFALRGIRSRRDVPRRVRAAAREQRRQEDARHRRDQSEGLEAHVPDRQGAPALCADGGDGGRPGAGGDRDARGRGHEGGDALISAAAHRGRGTRIVSTLAGGGARPSSSRGGAGRQPPT